MEDLYEMRKQIDEIDKKLVELFEERLCVVSKINEYKKIHSMPIEDKGREKELIEVNLAYCKNPKYSSYIIEFLESIIGISKRMQLNSRKMKNAKKLK